MVALLKRASGAIRSRCFFCKESKSIPSIFKKERLSNSLFSIKRGKNFLKHTIKYIFFWANPLFLIAIRLNYKRITDVAFLLKKLIAICSKLLFCKEWRERSTHSRSFLKIFESLREKSERANSQPWLQQWQRTKSLLFIFDVIFLLNILNLTYLVVKHSKFDIFLLLFLLNLTYSILKVQYCSLTLFSSFKCVW